MADPTPILSTITGASAGLVAIIGGLLVNRFVGIDSDQQGAKAVLDQAEERLRIARSRAEAAQQAWETFEFTRFLNASLLNAIRHGVRDAGEVGPSLLEETPLTVDQIQPRLQDAAEEYDQARTQLDDLLPAAKDLTADNWAGLTWASTRTGLQEVFPPMRWPSVWETAFDAVRDTRIQQRRQLDEAVKRKESPFGVEFPHMDLGFLAAVPPPVAGVFIAQRAQRIEHERAGLKTEKERTAQHLEDAEIEATRLRERRDAIVRPDRQLWIGIGVLLYPTLVSIVLPVLTMAGGPTSFTPGIRVLAWLFVSSLAWLLLYMTYLAARLSFLGRGQKPDRVARGTLAEFQEQATVRDHDTATAEPKTESLPDRAADGDIQRG